MVSIQQDYIKSEFYKYISQVAIDYDLFEYYAIAKVDIGYCIQPFVALYISNSETWLHKRWSTF